MLIIDTDMLFYIVCCKCYVYTDDACMILQLVIEHVTHPVEDLGLKIVMIAKKAGY